MDYQPIEDAEATQPSSILALPSSSLSLGTIIDGNLG
jgi:hypothetical protein